MMSNRTARISLSTSKPAMARDAAAGRSVKALARVVIVGAGQAGGYVAWALRSEGFIGEIVLVGDETHPPYQRPPLSKELLEGTCSIDSTYLWPMGIDATIRLGTAVRGINRAVQTIALSDGEAVWRTGEHTSELHTPRR